MPVGGDWFECNGPSVNASKYPEYVSLYGNTVPDYRGFFLRSQGGQSGTIGAEQKAQVGEHIHKVKVSQNNPSLGYVGGGYGYIAGLWIRWL